MLQSTFGVRGSLCPHLYNDRPVDILHQDELSLSVERKRLAVQGHQVGVASSLR